MPKTSNWLALFVAAAVFLTGDARAQEHSAQTPSGSRAGTAGNQGASPNDVAEAQRLAADAQAALAAGDHAREISDYEKLVKLMPKVAEVHANLATACYFAGRFDEAVPEAQFALKLKPSLVNAHYFLGLSLAEGGRCLEALPYLQQDYARVPDPKLKVLIGTNGLRCAIDAGQIDRALEFARSVGRDFPDDPEVLYLSSHLYSALANSATERLLESAPASYQAHQMSAEVLTIQGKLDDAAEEYHKVLALNPRLAGIHYELGRLLLAGTPSPENLAQARSEFEEELKIDPRNAAAESQIGDLAWQARQWNEAISHFQRAVQLEPDDTEALLGWGKSLVSAGRPQDAVAPLEKAVQLQPGDPSAHYQLSFAYRRLGKDAEAEKEMAMYRQTHDQLQQSKQAIRSGIMGEMTAKPQN